MKPIWRCQSDIMAPSCEQSITLYIFSRRSSGAIWRLILFYWAFFETVLKAVRMRSTVEVYGSLAYDGAPLLRVPFCISKAFLVLCDTDTKRLHDYLTLTGKTVD